MTSIIAFVVTIALVAGQAQKPPAVAVGSMAPEFTALDDRSASRSLKEFKGKYVVLEWHEKGCPDVTRQYRRGQMQALQNEWMARGVVWILVTSSVEGAHSYLTPEESQAYLAEQKATPTAMLLDTDGHVGHLYGAVSGLHMVVIDPTGKVIYNGAVDNAETNRSKDATGAVNYVGQALSEAMAGRPVSVPTSEPYGCSIHYAGVP